MSDTAKKSAVAGSGDILRFAAHYWARRKRLGALAVVLMAGATAADAFVPVYTGRIVDALRGADAAAALHAALRYLAVFVALAASQAAFRSIAQAVWNVFAARNMQDIAIDATARVQRFSSDWHANSFAGATVRKITRGIKSFDTFEDQLFLGLLPAFVIMSGVTTILLCRLPPVGLFAALMIVIYIGTSAFVSLRVLRPHFVVAAAADTGIGAALSDMITGNATVKSFAAEAREDAMFGGVMAHWRRTNIFAWQISEAANFTRNFLRVIMMGGMVGLTVLLWHRGRATPGDVAFALSSFFIVAGYLRDIGQQISNLQRSASELADVVLFRMYEDKVQDAADAKPFVRGAGQIEFDDVTFGYNAQAPLYADFSLTIAPGEHLALVGPSGAGKSTFMKLVQRLYDVQSGRIRIDGQDITHVTQDSLRAAVALIPQEPILFHRSLADNISYGRPDATMAEIVAAARRAYAHDFISALPTGYDTLVGERGIKLSGGERQRIAIARAILADTPILLLDEATSSLDSVSEHYIQKALAELVHGRTTVTIAHRLATIRAADRILVFEHGRIVEQGTHAALIAQAGSRYRQLYDMQALDLVGAGPAG